MTTNTLIAAALVLTLVGAVAGFFVGWIARRDDTQRYLQSRERYWERQLAETRDDRALAETDAARVPAPTPAPTVVHVHMPPAPVRRPRPKVIDAEVLDEAPAVVLVDLDNLALERGAPS